MASVIINDTNLTDIANAIREKNGTTDTYKPSEMAGAISSIEVGGGSASKYAPRHISFAYYTGTELEQELSNLDISNITSMNGFFMSCTKLSSLDLSNWDTSNVTNMQQMFYYCSSLPELDASSFDTSKVTTMYGMFRSCSGLQSLDLSSFTGEALTNTSYMFYGCSSLKKIDLRSMSFTSVTTYSSMFNNVPANCEIIVKDDTAKEWVLTVRSALTNVKTVAEL